MQYIIAALVFIALATGFLLLAKANKMTPKPAGCEDLTPACAGCKNISCGVKIANKIKAKGEEQ